MKKLSKEEAIDKFGEDTVNKAMKTNAEPTSRVMYPSYEVPSHIGKAEYAGDPVKVGGWKLTAYYYLSPETKRTRIPSTGMVTWSLKQKKFGKHLSPRQHG